MIVRLLAAIPALVMATTVAAFPEGAPWKTADDPAGCTACHFERPAVDESGAISLTGLPDAVSAGQSYSFTLALSDEQMQRAGFMLSVEAGTLTGTDGRAETKDSRARSTLTGSTPTGKGRAEWQLRWHLPEDLPDSDSIAITIHANAANYDESAFGDVIHRRSFTLPVKPGQ